MVNQTIIITDLDATLLEHDYTYCSALPALKLIQERKIPLILNSSKTVAELISLSKELDLATPIIAENGGTVGFPHDAAISAPKSDEESDGYSIIPTGLNRQTILEVAHSLRSKHKYQFQGFADWTPEQLCDITKLDIEGAIKAKQRSATEPILWEDTEERFKEFQTAISQKGIHIVRGGKFIHLMGDSNKADGAKVVLDAYEKQFPETDWCSIGLGDSENDLQMLELTDIACVIPHDGEIRIQPNNSNTHFATQAASKGWNECILNILTKK